MPDVLDQAYKNGHDCELLIFKDRLRFTDDCKYVVENWSYS